MRGWGAIADVPSGPRAPSPCGRAVLAVGGRVGVQLNLLWKVAHLPSTGFDEGLIIGFDFVD